MATPLVYLRVNASLDKYILDLRQNALCNFSMKFCFLFVYFLPLALPRDHLNSLPNLGRKCPEGMIPREGKVHLTA